MRTWHKQINFNLHSVSRSHAKFETFYYTCWYFKWLLKPI